MTDVEVAQSVEQAIAALEVVRIHDFAIRHDRIRVYEINHFYQYRVLKRWRAPAQPAVPLMAGIGAFKTKNITTKNPPNIGVDTPILAEIGRYVHCAAV